ncbi:RNA polymerase sigma factor CarQ [Posidoniimonas polymericola]|uniref:RNA polymerase sigma factor CarQ n=1 Tax=Posidoniimonas polymericola TaxID=2528002 RepID=A0A5C5YL66_9BACT|nr:sigma-70 family RNA polymerase sigma factor [Posidoniimonas polymericola]TWT75538.1 RNA polymerase sigma factor CarQ [Posidoniimonas polymericola]
MTTPPPISAQSSLSDRSLLRRFRSGEQDAATEIYVRYARRLQALASKQTGADLAARFDPEDVVQSVFRTFFRRASTGYYDVPAGEELWRLLLVLSLHKLRDLAGRHRAQKRDVSRTWSVQENESTSNAVSQDDQLAYSSLRMVVADLISDLPESNRQIIELRIEGHEVAEVAALSGRSKRTVERTLQQFRERLRSLIDAGDN